MNPKIPRKLMVNHNIQKKHHTKNHINWNSFGKAKKLDKLSKQRCDTHCHTYIHKIITQQPQMIKMQTQHQNVHQDVQFKHVKFHNHWIKTHHFTRDMESKVKITCMFTIPSTNQFPAMHKLGKNAHKKLETMRSMMQKIPHYLDQYLFSYEFLKWRKN